ncbi:MAG TPA: lysine--tRNA ligase, partial [Candidatus Saccharimonadales bacterium]|nr:lysine--tRNA ligase [Candidatus Saccharimonadales bacterium]
MQWLNKIVDDIVARFPEGEILVESGGSPSGTHHLGHMRELITCDAVMLELRKRGRQAKHIYFVDDLDALRKIPSNIPAEYEKYLGYPLCDIPAPDGSSQSYADYFLDGLVTSCKVLGVEVEFVRSHEKYRAGFFVPAIERCLERIPQARNALETISKHKLDPHWSPIQVMEDGRLKNRKYLSIDKDAKTVKYEDGEGAEQAVRYDKGEVKLDWRLDWPGRWWLLHVNAEPFGRDHASAGGSYDTGVQIMKDVYEAEPPLPVPYDFINLAGDTKKMSASKGTGLDAETVVKVLPPEIVRYLILRSSPLKRLYFDPENGVSQLVDEFAELMSTDPQNPVLYFSRTGVDPVISRVPFSHLVSSYQAALKNVEATLTILGRTGYQEVVEQNRQILADELAYIDEWLQRWAPEDVKFELRTDVKPDEFTDQERQFLQKLGDKVAAAQEDADGAWFHAAIYELKDEAGLEPKELFAALYKLLIGKTSGPRAGYFLSILPRDWLVKRLKLEA